MDKIARKEATDYMRNEVLKAKLLLKEEGQVFGFTHIDSDIAKLAAFFLIVDKAPSYPTGERARHIINLADLFSEVWG